MPPLSSWNGQLPTDVQLDSGILYINGAIFSAQDGGLKFDPGKEIRDIPFDGRRSKVKGIDRTVFWTPVISGNIMQVPVANFGVIEPGASAPSSTITGGPSGATQRVGKSAGVLYASGDYIVQPRVVWYRGDGTYVQVRFFDGGLCTKWDETGQDKSEVKYAIEIEARLDLTASGRQVYDCPFVMEYFSVAPA